jgi:hypothetical protein
VAGVVEPAGGAEGGGDAVDDAGEAGLDVGADLLAEGADGTGEPDRLRDDVVGSPP